MESGEWERLERAEHLKSLALWRVCEQLSAFQAASLIVETDPSNVPTDEIDDWRLPQGFTPIFAALKGAILSGKLKATIRKHAHQIVLDAPPGAMAHFAEGGVQHLYGIRPDWHGTLIEVTDLREWLLQRGVASAYFFPDGLPKADYLNRSDPNFSTKLYAAIAAWMAVKADPALKEGKSVKTALTNWLNKNAAQHGLLKDDGKLNTEAIGYIAKVANWDTKGGVPKTPAKPTHPLRRK